MKYKLVSPTRTYVETSDELNALLKDIKPEGKYVAHVRRLYSAASGLYRYALLTDECAPREYPTGTYSASIA